MKVSKDYVQIGSMGKSNKGRWKNRWRITQAENIDIDVLAKSIATRAMQHTKKTLSFFDSKIAKMNKVYNATELAVNECISAIIDADRPKEKK